MENNDLFSQEVVYFREDFQDSFYLNSHRNSPSSSIKGSQSIKFLFTHSPTGPVAASSKEEEIHESSGW